MDVHHYESGGKIIIISPVHVTQDHMKGIVHQKDRTLMWVAREDFKNTKRHTGHSIFSLSRPFLGT